MEKSMNCFICKKELYSGIGKGCNMCGMLLEEKQEDFCCKECQNKWRKINNEQEN